MCEVTPAPFLAPLERAAITPSSRSGFTAEDEDWKGLFEMLLVITLRTPSTMSLMSWLTEEFSISIAFRFGVMSFQIQATRYWNHSRIA
jgi:hypothetical protein